MSVCDETLTNIWDTTSIPVIPTEDISSLIETANEEKIQEEYSEHEINANTIIEKDEASSNLSMEVTEIQEESAEITTEAIGRSCDPNVDNEEIFQSGESIEYAERSEDQAEIEFVAEKYCTNEAEKEKEDIREMILPEDDKKEDFDSEVKLTEEEERRWEDEKKQKRKATKSLQFYINQSFFDLSDDEDNEDLLQAKQSKPIDISQEGIRTEHEHEEHQEKESGAEEIDEDEPEHKNEEDKIEGNNAQEEEEEEEEEEIEEVEGKEEEEDGDTGSGLVDLGLAVEGKSNVTVTRKERKQKMMQEWEKEQERLQTSELKKKEIFLQQLERKSKDEKKDYLPSYVWNGWEWCEEKWKDWNSEKENCKNSENVYSVDNRYHEEEKFGLTKSADRKICDTVSFLSLAIKSQKDGEKAMSDFAEVTELEAKLQDRLNRRDSISLVNQEEDAYVKPRSFSAAVLPSHPEEIDKGEDMYALRSTEMDSVRHENLTCNLHESGEKWSGDTWEDMGIYPKEEPLQQEQKMVTPVKEQGRESCEEMTEGTGIIKQEDARQEERSEERNVWAREDQNGTKKWGGQASIGWQDDEGNFKSNISDSCHT